MTETSGRPYPLSPPEELPERVGQVWDHGRTRLDLQGVAGLEIPSRGAQGLLQAFSETRDFAVFTLDLHGSIVDWMGASSAVFGYEHAEVAGRSFSLLFSERDRSIGMDAQELRVAASIGRSEDDRWHRRKSGALFWGSGMLQALHDADGSVAGFCKILRDRTDVRSQLERLQNQLASERAANSDLKESLATLVHELRNPLAPVSAAAHILSQAEHQEVRSQAAQLLSRQLALMTRLLDDYAESTRQERRRFHPRPLELQAELNSAVGALQPVAAEKQLRLKLVLPAVPITVDADPVLLQQMLLNLLGNALKYTPPGGLITLSASVEAQTVAIRIEDNGIGISPDLLPSIFELFTRGTEDESAPQGEGIGLSVVSHLASLHGGNVEARSNGANQGSAFTLRLPLRAHR